MRSLRPPPKVTPPKPPAHLFEPRDDVVPVRLDTRVTQQQRPPATMAYEDDVKFQMQQLEEEMKQLLAKESGGISPVPAQDYVRRAEPPRIQSRPDDQSQVPRSIAKASLGGRDPFSTSINPADWRKNGYPSEFAYMKAMGQLEISNAPPSILSQAPKVSAPTENPSLSTRESLQASSGGRDPFSTNINPADWRKNGYPSEFAYMKAMGQLEISNAPPSILSQAPKVSVGNKDFPSEREKGSPVRRKGGAIQNLYNDEDDLRRKFVNQHQYSDQLQRQADEQRRAKESEQLDHRGLRGGPESSGLNRDMHSGTGLSLHPPMTDRNPEREKGSPIRRKGGAIQNLYNDEDDLRSKFVNQHLYSDQLQRQADEQKRAKESELLDHRGLRGGVESSQVQGMRFPSERGSNHRQPAPHHAGPAPSYGAQSGGPPVRHAEQSMPSYHPDLSLQQQSQSYADPRSMGRDPSPARRQIPMEDSRYRGPPQQQQQQHPPLTNMHTNSPSRRQISEAANTSLPLGMDKQSELALKRAKQEEYKRQLDSLKPRQEVIPTAHTAMVDSKSYLHTGVRATTQGPPPRADPYHSSLPAQRNQPLPAAAAYAPRGNYDDSAEKYASSNHFDHMRDTHNAPLQVRNQTDHLNYNNSDPRLQTIPSNPYSQYPTTSTGAAVDPYAGRYEQSAAPIRPAGDPRGLPPGMRYPDPSLEDAYIRAAMEARNRDVQSYDRGFVESIPRNIPPQGGGMPMPAQRPSAGVDPRDEKLMKKQQQEEYRRELERQVEAKKAQKEIAKKEEEERDVRLLESLASVAAADGGSNQRGKKPAVASQQRSDHPPPQQQQAPPMDNRYEDDIAAEIAYMKAKGMLPPADDFSRDGRSEVRFEDQRSDYGEDRRMMPDPSYNDRNNGSHGYPDDRNQYPQPGRGRGLSLDTDPMSSQYTATVAASSPYKSPNQARTRFMQDIYGDLISHTDKNTTGGGDATANSTAWRPSGGGSTDEKRRQVILDQRQALDRQKAEIEARKKREKEEEDERDRKKEARDREAIAKQEEAEMLERKKVFFICLQFIFYSLSSLILYLLYMFL